MPTRSRWPFIVLLCLGVGCAVVVARRHQSQEFTLNGDTIRLVQITPSESLRRPYITLAAKWDCYRVYATRASGTQSTFEMAYLPTTRQALLQIPDEGMPHTGRADNPQQAVEDYLTGRVPQVQMQTPASFSSRMKAGGMMGGGMMPPAAPAKIRGGR
jgi:hypothetical protein